MLAGTNFVDALKIFEDDPDTEGILLVGEVGGMAEVDAAEWIREYYGRCEFPKPVMAVVGGMQAPPGRVMGHAGAWAAPGEPDARDKYRILENAGVVMVNHPEEFGEGMKSLLSKRAGLDGKKVCLDILSLERSLTIWCRASSTDEGFIHREGSLSKTTVKGHSKSVPSTSDSLTHSTCSKKNPSASTTQPHPTPASPCH